MGTTMYKRSALDEVINAADTHSKSLEKSLKTAYNPNPSFMSARSGYIRQLNEALTEVRQLKLDETNKVVERVRDLDLEESVDLLHAVEDHIRKLRQHSVSNLA